MTEYIDREALKNDIAKSTEPFNTGSVFRAINRQIVADVAPVAHGRWIDKPLIKSFKHTNIPVVECSVCGIDFCDIINNHYFMYKYCPNCGAKMDG